MPVPGKQLSAISSGWASSTLSSGLIHSVTNPDLLELECFYVKTWFRPYAPGRLRKLDAYLRGIIHRSHVRHKRHVHRPYLSFNSARRGKEKFQVFVSRMAHDLIQMADERQRSEWIPMAMTSAMADLHE